MNFGLLFSPFVAGAVYERAGYYAVFGVVLGVVAFDFVLRVAMIEKRVAASWTAGMSLGDGDSHDESTQVDQSSGSSTTAAEEEEDLNQPASEQNERTPLLPPRSCSKNPGGKKPKSWLSTRFPMATVLFSSPRLNAAIYGGFLHTMLISSFDTILPTFVINTFHWKATAGGLIFLAITVPSLTSAFVGMLSDRYGARLTSLIGFAFVTPILALLGLCKDDSTTSMILLEVFLVFIGLGLNFMLTPLAADVFHEASILARKNPTLFGVMGAFAPVYSLFNGALGVAVIVGPGLSGTLYDKTDWKITMGVLAGLCAAGAAPVWLYTGNEKRKRGNEEEGAKGNV